jgi:PST family polysaccharide transporter
MSGDVKRKTFLAMAWNMINQMGVQGLGFFFSIYLARLLSPSEYGLIAMVTVFTGLIGLVIDFGFGSAAIQRTEVDEDGWATIFHTTVVVGLLSFSGFWLLAPWIAEYYNHDELIPITRLIGAGVLISALSIVLRNKLMKALDFKKLSLINLLGALISGVVGVIMAENGYGVYSLVFLRISNYVVVLIGLWIVSRFWLPRLVYSIEFVKSIFSYSSYTFLSHLLGYATRNTDNMLIGKKLGDEALGEYNRAYSFLMFPIQTISRVITSVLFPSFSIIKDDLPKVRQSFMKLSSVVSTITIILMANLFISAEEVVLLVFKAKWLGIVPFIRAFALMGVYQSIISLNAPLYTALSHMKLDLKVGMFTEVVFIVCIIIGVNWGVFGVITALYVGTLINFYPTNYFILKKVGISLGQYYRLFLTNTILIIVLIVGLEQLYNHFLDFDSVWANLFIKSGLLTLLFGLFHLVVKTKEFALVKEALSNFGKKKEA